MRHLMMSFAVCAAVSLLGQPASAATYFWDGDGAGTVGGGNGQWDKTNARWCETSDGSTYVAWAGSNNAIFANTPGTVNLVSSVNIHDMTFDVDGYTVSSSSSGSMTLYGSTPAMPAFKVTNANDTATISAKIAGTSSFNLTKYGAGTLILSGANTYAGRTFVYEGTLSVATINDAGTTGTLGAASNVTNGLSLTGGTLRYTGETASTTRGFLLGSGTISTIDVSNSSTELTFSGGTYASAGSLNKSGAGTLVLSGASAHTGVTTISEGVLSVALIKNGGLASGNLSAATADAANLVFNGGTLRYTGVTASTNRSFTINDGKSGTIDVNSSDAVLTVLGSSAATSGSLVKTGAGGLILGGVYAHTGDTVIQEGMLTKYLSTCDISDSSAIKVANGATYRTVVSSSQTLSASDVRSELTGSGIEGLVGRLDSTTGVPSGGTYITMKWAAAGGSADASLISNKLTLTNTTDLLPTEGYMLTMEYNPLSAGGGTVCKLSGDEWVNSGSTLRGSLDTAPIYMSAETYAAADLQVGDYGVDLTNQVAWVMLSGNLGSGGGTTFGVVGVPEPGTLALLAAGMFGLLAYAWRKRKVK